MCFSLSLSLNLFLLFGLTVCKVIEYWSECDVDGVIVPAHRHHFDYALVCSSHHSTKYEKNIIHFPSCILFSFVNEMYMCLCVCFFHAFYAHWMKQIDWMNGTSTQTVEKMCVIVTHKYHVTQFLLLLLLPLFFSFRSAYMLFSRSYIFQSTQLSSPLLWFSKWPNGVRRTKRWIKWETELRTSYINTNTYEHIRTPINTYIQT